MADESYRCWRGWILEPQSDGTLLPMFLKVRYNDIIYWPDMIYSDTLLNALTGHRITIHGSSELCTMLNAWDVKVFEDHSYRAKIVVPVVAIEPTADAGQKFIKNTVINNGLFGYITLPFATKYDMVSFNVQVSVVGGLKALAAASTVVVPGVKTESEGVYTPVESVFDSTITELFVQISTSETLPDDILSDDNMKRAAVLLTVTGQLDLEQEAIVPEVALADAYSGNVISFD